MIEGYPETREQVLTGVTIVTFISSFYFRLQLYLQSAGVLAKHFGWY